ncbi:MAG: FprA family A-type flavoprotein, partial [Oscillospiraceae bacterium]
MSARIIKQDVFSVGVMNPALRVFDIIMKTEYGTSYNAYLVKGEKTALIETVHVNFFDEYLENIQSIVDVQSIDYLILNHTEPDHTGSIAKLLEKNPNIQIIGSMAAIKYAGAIVNSDFNKKIVKDGETLDLGNGKVLKFMISPFLHWPDSMFTYLESEKTLFSCDFLGAHYCEPRVFDNHVMYKDKYAAAFDYYYAAIFGPFKEYVLKGLDKIKDLDLDVVAPSHGPVLVEGIKAAMDKYRQYSLPVLNKNEIKKILILYVSAYGCTKTLAKRAYDVCKEAGFDVEMHDIIKNDESFLAGKIHEADGLMFGSPTINRDALKPVWDMIS